MDRKTKDKIALEKGHGALVLNEKERERSNGRYHARQREFSPIALKIFAVGSRDLCRQR
jgi:hypothetical protein